MTETGLLEDLPGRLGTLYDRTAETPLFNPVGQLGFELSRALEKGSIDLGQIASTIDDYESGAFAARARRLQSLLAPVNMAENDDRLARLAGAEPDFAAFAARWSRPLLGCVFTAHPTFMLSGAGYAALAELASGGAEDPVLHGDMPTLESEHDAVAVAIERAWRARFRIAAQLLDTARARFPDDWRALRPSPFSFATWVGYDMDGRTDIGWATPIRFRLKEKAEQLRRYRLAFTALPRMSKRVAEIAARIERAEQYSAEMHAAFAGALDDPASISAAANTLTASHEDKLISLDAMLEELDVEIAGASDEDAAALMPIAAAMRSDRLGIGTVHFRMNASQVHNAVRRRIGDDSGLAMNSRGALARLRRLIAEAKPVPVNFAALAIETTTAIRQFIAMAQMLKHIDADSPIRLLIAECEQPATVLAALYFARLFGIDDRVDISPLFETSEALEHGGRFLDALLGEKSYRAYARARGRVAIQTGFSDAGRFMGQIPAALAIERLQGRLAALMTHHGLADTEALIFNTHGESMGRGAHPLSVEDRLAHCLSIWARQQFRAGGIALRSEVSFQGGDGYLFFGTDDLAHATLMRIAEAGIALGEQTDDDPFYTETDVSLDFYRDVRRVQARLFRDPSYNRALTAFGLGLLPSTGSRRLRRQTDVAADRDMSLRRIRAIPHNAVLQQLGYPVNVIAGMGTATGGERERFAALFRRSRRAQDLVRLVAAADRLASIKTLVAYGEPFNGAYWATRPYRGGEEAIEPASLDLAERLAGDDRTAAFRELATQLRVDGLKLRRLVDLLPADALPPRDEPRRRTLGILHALRLALMQHIFLRAAAIPPFSRRNDISREDIMDMVLALRIDEALVLLREAYPVEAPSLDQFEVTEAAGYPSERGAAYARIHEDYIDAIDAAHGLMLRISRAIAHHFSAHG